jgi:hypothetical protein
MNKNESQVLAGGIFAGASAFGEPGLSPTGAEFRRRCSCCSVSFIVNSFEE